MIKVPLFLRIWIPFVIVISAFCFLSYASVQQNYRQSANDPQIQISEDIAVNLINGKTIESQIPQNSVDISKSLAPFIIVFDEKGNVIASNANLDGKIPTPPPGVFAYTKTNKQNRFTWQPRQDVRSATVIAYFSGKTSGYVLVGRSIREIEKREDQVFVLAKLTWIGALVATFVAVLVFV